LGVGGEAVEGGLNAPVGLIGDGLEFGSLGDLDHDLTNLTQGVGGPQDPAVLYTPQAIVAELDGLTVHRAERVRRPVDTAPEPGVAVDTLVRATRD
jgi:hypothetical protein